MATELLHCCICPKRPDFSDTSHLLTHVSSKGHLSHLHKLQVRSHQEIPAVQQLTVYNQWFTEHHVAHLLSERMQQKEQKQARRKVEQRNRYNSAQQQSQLNVDPNLLPAISGTRVHESGYVPSSLVHDGLGDTASYTPTKMSRADRLQSAQPTRSTQDLPLWSRPVNGSSNSPSNDLQTASDTTPDMARLKGTIWPGMDMFDSADQETQRKRNQRKDVSVLERMQAMSKLVEPMETVSSPGGTMKKQRHMDHLEDDSPVEGESPVLKQSSKRKRKALGSLSTNITRKSTYKTRRAGALMTSLTPTRADILNMDHRRPRRVGPLLFKDIVDTQQFSSVTPIDRGKQNIFDIYDDQMFDLGVDYTARLVTDAFRNDRRTPGAVQPLVFPPATWLQPLYQGDQIYDPFKDYRSARVLPNVQTEVGGGKENENPLIWQKGSTKATSTTTPGFYDTFDDFDETFGALADVYAFTKNPLIGNTPRPHATDQTPCRSTTKPLLFNRKISHYR